MLTMITDDDYGDDVVVMVIMRMTTLMTVK